MNKQTKKYIYALPLLIGSLGVMVGAHAQERKDYQVFPVHLE